MSYDLNLRDPVTRETLEVPAHMMYGGNVRCEVRDGQLVPTTTTEAYLNITYNYAPYYYAAFASAEDNPEQYASDQKAFGLKHPNGGIRAIQELTGLEAIPLLEEMIRRIEVQHKNPDGSWKQTVSEEKKYVNRITGEVKTSTDMFIYFLKLRGDRKLSEEEAAAAIDEEYKLETTTIIVDEGSDGGSYWACTAANAIRPLHQLIAMSKMRPDGVWTEDS